MYDSFALTNQCDIDGVTLCWECHKLTKNYKNKKYENFTNCR